MSDSKEVVNRNACLGCEQRDSDLAYLRMRFDTILGRDIEICAAEQDFEWGGPDGHTLRDWPMFIEKQVEHAKRLAVRHELCGFNNSYKVTVSEVEAEYEQRMIKIATLAILAIQSTRRKAAKRHDTLPAGSTGYPDYEATDPA
jgi:hypothetical protein